MQYKDLKEVDPNDWDGKPFEAILMDDSFLDEDLWLADWYILTGQRKPSQKVARWDKFKEKWIATSGTSWDHTYRISENMITKTPKENKMTKLITVKELNKKIKENNEAARESAKAEADTIFKMFNEEAKNIYENGTEKNMVGLVVAPLSKYVVEIVSKEFSDAGYCVEITTPRAIDSHALVKTRIVVTW